MTFPTSSNNKRIKGRKFDDSKINLKDYFSLTKPRIIILLTVTGIGGFFVPQPNMNGVSFLDLLIFVFVGYASAGGAMTISNYIDRDIDALMERTKERALPSGKIKPSDLVATSDWAISPEMGRPICWFIAVTPIANSSPASSVPSPPLVSRSGIPVRVATSRFARDPSPCTT